MSGSVVTSLMTDQPGPGTVQLGLVNRLLDTLDQSLLVAERGGKILLANSRAKQCLESIGLSDTSTLNLYDDVLQVEAKQIFSGIENGEQEVRLNLTRGDKKASATVNWVPEPDWVVVQFTPMTDLQPAPDPVTQIGRASCRERV